MRVALKGILKEAGRKAHSANFKHMHIADSRYKGRRIAIMSSNGHEKTKETSNFKNCKLQKGNRDPEKVTKQGEDIVRVSV